MKAGKEHAATQSDKASLGSDSSSDSYGNSDSGGSSSNSQSFFSTAADSQNEALSFELAREGQNSSGVATETTLSQYPSSEKVRAV